MFCSASGLEVNKHKFEVYYARVSYQMIKRVTDVSCFNVGTLAFRYRGVPMSTRKLKVSNCQALIGIMISRIRL